MALYSGQKAEQKTSAPNITKTVTENMMFFLELVKPGLVLEALLTPALPLEPAFPVIGF